MDTLSELKLAVRSVLLEHFASGSPDAGMTGVGAMELN
jgi:hypothetical protein